MPCGLYTQGTNGNNGQVVPITYVTKFPANNGPWKTKFPEQNYHIRESHIQCKTAAKPLALHHCGLRIVFRGLYKVSNDTNIYIIVFQILGENFVKMLAQGTPHCWHKAHIISKIIFRFHCRQIPRPNWTN